MKVHMNIATGWKRGELIGMFEENPDTAIDPDLKLSAVKQWVINRYGGWLHANDITEFDIYETSCDHFRIDFLHDTDASEFIRQIGGTLLEE